jgi:hypothetical protein
VRKRARLNGGDVGSEFDMYIANPNGNDNIKLALDWWRENSSKYLTLKWMAKDYLAVPASGCLVERAFSVAGKIVTWERHNLKSQRVCDSMIYNSWLKRENKWKHIDKVGGFDADFLLDLVDDHGDEMPEFEDGSEDTILKEWRGNWWNKRSKK